MALQRKPHAVTVVEADEQQDPFGTVSHVDFENGTARNVQITPMMASVALTRFGLDAAKPHQLLDDLDGYDLYRVGYRVVYGTRLFAVKAVMKWDAEPTTSCVEVVLEEITPEAA